MRGFRQSRVAMLIDLLLLPLGILKGVCLFGILEVLSDLRNLPTYFTSNWPNRHWLFRDKDVLH